MKTALLGSIALTLILLSCDKAYDNITPSDNKDVLGLVVQVASNQTQDLILLKDGRAISPQSGFNPTQLKAGDKFVLSFEPASTSGKILNVNVTNFSSAKDSTFIPPPSSVDSSAFKTALAGSHLCLFTSATVDYSHPADTVKIVKEFNLVVNGNTFESNAPYSPVPGGAGIFYFSGNEPNNLYFLNYDEIPSSAGVPPGYLLNGQYYHALFDKYILIWTYTNTYYTGFLVSK